MFDELLDTHRNKKGLIILAVAVALKRRCYPFGFNRNTRLEQTNAKVKFIKYHGFAGIRGWASPDLALATRFSNRLLLPIPVFQYRF